MNEDYKPLISEIIQKQRVILGPDIALSKARRVGGLTVDDEGKVLEVKGEPQAVLQQLVDEYISLSGEIVKNVLNPVLAKYPDIKVNLQ